MGNPAEKLQLFQNTEEVPSNFQEFEVHVSKLVTKFPNNEFFRFIDSGKLTMEHYHKLLCTIFHQTYYSSNSFALAAAHCPAQYTEVRDYLIEHASEEKTHWQWLLNDLEHSGFKGKDPRQTNPTPFCQGYISLNFHAAISFPVYRLAIATFLESVASQVGGKYAPRLCELLKLKKDMVSFFMSHSETDTQHTKDLLALLKQVSLPSQEWGKMAHFAEAAMNLYREMYSEVIKCSS